jgi:hypothetical protein
MSKQTLNLTEQERILLETEMDDVDFLFESFLISRINSAKERVIEESVKRAFAEDLPVPPTADEIISMAISKGWVRKAGDSERVDNQLNV